MTPLRPSPLDSSVVLASCSGPPELTVAFRRAARLPVQTGQCERTAGCFGAALEPSVGPTMSCRYRRWIRVLILPLRGIASVPQEVVGRSGLLPKRVKPRKRQSKRIRQAFSRWLPRWLYCAAGPESPAGLAARAKTMPDTTSAADHLAAVR